jgi:hypothetical protein
MGNKCASAEFEVVNRLVPAFSQADCDLQVLVIYEDAHTLKLAKRFHSRLEGAAGKGNLHSTWWNVRDLTEPTVFAASVSTAMHAQVIVTSFHAQKKLPLGFYLWVNAWLHHRAPGSGTLVGLVSLPEHRNGDGGHVQDYLNRVAQNGRLGLVMEERKTAPPAGHRHQFSGMLETAH